jgi:hypothetical protein
MSEEFVTIVSGLPRSGTSMMMQLLEAGGIPILKDDIREPDEDNPKGYYEFERVKKIADDKAWLEDARGKAVKMVSALLPQLPNNYRYRLIFMHRRIEEILASQKVMLTRMNKPPDKVSDEKMASFFQNHLRQIEKWVEENPNIQALHIDYNDVITDPGQQVEKINQFLGGNLDTERMRGVVDRTLYRERKPKAGADKSA